MALQGMFILVAGFYRLPDDLPDPVWRYPMFYIAFHPYAFQVRRLLYKLMISLHTAEVDIEAPVLKYWIIGSSKKNCINILLCRAIDCFAYSLILIVNCGRECCKTILLA